MATSDGPAFSWMCPACGRRVPQKLRQCRCGHVTDGPPQDIEPRSQEPESPGSPGPGWWSNWIAMVAFAAALGMLWMYTRRVPEQRVPAAPVVYGPVRVTRSTAPELPQAMATASTEPQSPSALTKSPD
jgi:hypothetical protein